jgi:threonine/homoserine/homoserine lactone efflux protein
MKRDDAEHKLAYAAREKRDSGWTVAFFYAGGVVCVLVVLFLILIGILGLNATLSEGEPFGLACTLICLAFAMAFAYVAYQLFSHGADARAGPDQPKERRDDYLRRLRGDSDDRSTRW